MDISSLPTEVRRASSDRPIAKIYLDWMPQPGNYVDVDGKAYIVLERRHRYHLRRGQYQLAQVVIYVQDAPIEQEQERTLWEGRWVLGDASCIYSAHSELLRCAVNPAGPCEGCRYFEKNQAV